MVYLIRKLEDRDENPDTSCEDAMVLVNLAKIHNVDVSWQDAALAWDYFSAEWGCTGTMDISVANNVNILYSCLFTYLDKK